MIAWTVTASGGALSGQVLAPAAVRRGLFGQWRQALGLNRSPRTPSAGGTAVYLHARGVLSGVTVSVTATVLDDGEGPVAAPGTRTRRPGQARQYRAPAGLLEKLMAAVRPEFRAGDLVFDPRDPVFGGPPCAVRGCDRPHRRQGLCTSHWQRWRGSGGTSLAEFTATAAPGWHGHLPLDSCVIDGCNYGAMGRGMCMRHFSRWYRTGRPDLAGWQAQATPLPPDGPLRRLPDRLLLLVDPRHVGVLLRPRHPLEGQRVSRYR